MRFGSDFYPFRKTFLNFRSIIRKVWKRSIAVVLSMLFSLSSLELLHSKKSQNSKCPKWKKSNSALNALWYFFLLMFFSATTYLALQTSWLGIARKYHVAAGQKKMKIKKIAKFDYHSLSSNNVGFFLFFVRLLQGNLVRGIDNKTNWKEICMFSSR